jgi:hypothetical protein
METFELNLYQAYLLGYKQGLLKAEQYLRQAKAALPSSQNLAEEDMAEKDLAPKDLKRPPASESMPVKTKRQYHGHHQ